MPGVDLNPGEVCAGFMMEQIGLVFRDDGMQQVLPWSLSVLAAVQQSSPQISVVCLLLCNNAATVQQCCRSFPTQQCCWTFPVYIVSSVSTFCPCYSIFFCCVK